MQRLLEHSPRSLLYNIEPVGQGTPYVESLTSYVTRLANYHCLSFGTFMSKLLTPYFNKSYLTKIAQRGGNGFYDSSQGINSIGTLAEDFVDVIQSLNYRTDLNKLTLKHLENIFPTRGLMRNYKAWCSLCYQEAMSNKEAIYDQLLWYLKAAQYCPKHKSILNSKCPTCSMPQQILSRKTIPGYCQHCKGWLGEDSLIDSKDCINERDLKAAILIGNMLSYSSSNNVEKNRENSIALSFNKILSLHFEGNINKMANVLNVANTTLRYWIRGQNLPPLPSLINVCIKLNISILQFLEIENLPSLEIPKESSKLLPKKRTQYNHKRIKRILHKEINKENPNSLKKVAEIIGCDRKLLYKIYPLESEMIVKNYSLYVENKKIKRLRIISQELTKGIGQLMKNNEYPSRRKVEYMLRNRYFVREKRIGEEWNKIAFKKKV